MKRLLFVITLIFSTFSVSAQDGMPAYRITFSDKNNSPYSIERPEEFLSPRAIDKRNRFNIALTEDDLPVNPQYLSAVRDVDSRIRILSVSKWSNTAVILCPDLTVIGHVEQLPFVTSALKVANYMVASGRSASASAAATFPHHLVDNKSDTSVYGYACRQIALHNGHLLHAAGFRGEGMLIAVLDAGWNQVDSMEVFQPLFDNRQIEGEYDLLPFSDDVYSGHGHGTLVTSEMALSVQDSFIGTAPAAHYVLIRSEDPDSEQPIEQDYWARGAELADSLGADVISSSLGYTRFPDFEEYDFEYSSCDGTSICSRAATRAAHCGIIVCVAVGNEGYNEWHKLSRPGDAEDILCVGAVDRDSVYAPFSSVGPSYDGRVKPDVAAVGRGSYFWNEYNQIISGDGTSCATPIIGGLSACLWQALPDFSSLEIMQIIRENSHHFLEPDTLSGYGIPDFYNAYIRNMDTVGIESVEGRSAGRTIFPNPTDGKIMITGNNIREIAVYDISGRLVKKQKSISDSENSIEIDLSPVVSGIYLLQVTGKNDTTIQKIIKIKH